MTRININLNVENVQEAIEAFKALQAAGINPIVTTQEKAKRFRMTREQKTTFDNLPEDKREEYRQGLMQAAGFAEEATQDIMPEDDGRDPLA